LGGRYILEVLKEGHWIRLPGLSSTETQTRRRAEKYLKKNFKCRAISNGKIMAIWEGWEGADTD
jgi:hypothetical protein